ncbi:MAG: NUDIX hydrolase [Alteraurantiacibacter sp.]
MPVEDANAPEEIMWSGKWIVACRRGKWEYVSRARGIKAAVILAVDGPEDDRHIILVEQYRVPVGGPVLELPAGLVGDEDGTEGEAALESAQRELIEETGYAATHWQDCGVFQSSPGLTGETFTLLKATGLTKVGLGGGTEAENIVVHRLPLADIAAQIAPFRARGVAMDVRLLAVLGPHLLGV